MKKTTKALYSAVAGLALIASSGGGTYALWRDGAALGATHTQIQTGDLRLDFVSLTEQSHPACGTATSLTQQVCWTMTPPATSGNQPVSSFDFQTLHQVEQGYKLSGSTKIRGTIEGATILANLNKPIVSYQVNSDIYETAQNAAQLRELKSWLSDSVTLIEIKDADGRLIAGTNVTTPITLDNNGVYTVTVSVQFPNRALPPRTGVPISAYLYLGQIDLVLRQNVSGQYFGPLSTN